MCRVSTDPTSPTAADPALVPVAPAGAAAAPASSPTADDGDALTRQGWLLVSGLGVVLALAFALTGLGPAALAAAAVVLAGRTVLTRRGGVVWWTVLEVALVAVAAVVGLLVTDVGDSLPPGALALQLVGGAVTGVVLLVVLWLAVLRPRPAAPEGPPTAG